jgi:hypothetical protein
MAVQGKWLIFPFTLSQHWVEMWIGEHLHSTFPGGDKYLLAAPTKGDLICLHILLM